MIKDRTAEAAGSRDIVKRHCDRSQSRKLTTWLWGNPSTNQAYRAGSQPMTRSYIIDKAESSVIMPACKSRRSLSSPIPSDSPSRHITLFLSATQSEVPTLIIPLIKSILINALLPFIYQTAVTLRINANDIISPFNRYQLTIHNQPLITPILPLNQYTSLSSPHRQQSFNMLPTDQPSNNDLRAPRPNLLIPASNTASRSIQPSPLSLFRNPSPRPLPTPESESLTPRPTAPPRQQTPRITLRPSLPSIHTLPFQSQPDYPSHHQPQPQYTVRYQPYPTPQPTYIYAIPNPGTSFTGAQPFFTNTNATSQHFTPAPNTYNSYSSGSSPLDRTAPEKFLIGQPSGGSTMQYNSYQAGGAMQSSRNGSIGEGYGVERMAGGSSGDAGGYPRGYSVSIVQRCSSIPSGRLMAILSK